MKVQSALQRDARERLSILDALLERAYRTPEDTLGNKPDPLDEAIYIILSFQTDIARFGATWTRLKTRFPTWELLEQAPVSVIASVLRDGGLHRQKARTIKQLLYALRGHVGSLSLDLLRDMDTHAAERFLLGLPGFSWKSARCVLLYSLGRDVFPIDSNTFRILKRVSVLRPRAVYRRKPLHDDLQNAVASDRRRTLHVNLVIHGQRTCLPQTPRCEACVASSVCPAFGVPGQPQLRRKARG